MELSEIVRVASEIYICEKSKAFPFLANSNGRAAFTSVRRRHIFAFNAQVNIILNGDLYAQADTQLNWLACINMKEIENSDLLSIRIAL